MKRIIALFPTFTPPVDDARKETLATAIINALEGGANEADVAQMLEHAGANAADSAAAGNAIFKAYEAKKAAEKRSTQARGPAKFGAIMATIGVIALGVLLYLAFSRPVPVSKDEMVELMAPVAKTADLTKVTTAMTGRFDDLDTAVADLAKKSDLDDLSGKMDAVAGSVERTEKIVTVGLTYRARCKSDDTDTACVQELDCKGEGAKKRCYKRVPFQAASASQVARFRNEAFPPEEKPAVEDDGKKAPADKKAEEKKAPVTCPTGCQPVAGKCPTACGSITVEVPDGYRLEPTV